MARNLQWPPWNPNLILTLCHKHFLTVFEASEGTKRKNSLLHPHMSQSVWGGVVGLEIFSGLLGHSKRKNSFFYPHMFQPMDGRARNLQWPTWLPAAFAQHLSLVFFYIHTCPSQCGWGEGGLEICSGLLGCQRRGGEWCQ